MRTIKNKYICACIVISNYGKTEKTSVGMGVGNRF